MPKHRVIPVWPAVTLVAVLALASALIILHLARTRSEQAGRLGKLEAVNRDLEKRSEGLARELDALRRSLAEPAEAPESGPVRPRYRLVLPQEGEPKQLAQMRDSLAAANSSIASLEARIQELEANLDKVTAENQRLAASEADLREKVAGTSRVLEAVQVELKTKSDRLTQAEITNNLLHEQNRALSDKAAQFKQLMGSLEEINRRREGYLSSILRRYREVTDQYRALSGRLESPRDNASPPGPELSRIESSIISAEEDFRQLTALNAQAARLQQKMAGK